MTVGLWRIRTDEGVALARGDSSVGPADLLAEDLDVSDFLTDDGSLFAALAELPSSGPVPSHDVLPPVDRQPIWAAGVTFERSRAARREEADDGGDVYDRVYVAARPELFVKATPESVVGPGDAVGIRADSDWNVPEPELAVVAGASGEIRALTLGNDMSSRSIEGENPLYLPQAKVYDRSCALGPCLVPVNAAPLWSEIEVTITITRAGGDVYADTVSLATMRRTPQELVGWLCAATTFPAGVVLLTGTSMVPPAELTLAPDDETTIASTHLGTLRNRVVVVGATVGSAR
jgi:2-dehydro-3-deoxy-D-arabinonate dehydratase